MEAGMEAVALPGPAWVGRGAGAAAELLLPPAGAAGLGQLGRLSPLPGGQRAGGWWIPRRRRRKRKRKKKKGAGVLCGC